MEVRMDVAAIGSSTSQQRGPSHFRLERICALALACVCLAAPGHAQPTLLLLEGGKVTPDNAASEIGIDEIGYHSVAGSYVWAARVKADGHDLIVGNLNELESLTQLVQPSSWSGGAQIGLERSFGLGSKGELVYSALIADRPAALDTPIYGVLDSIWLRNGTGYGEDTVIARRGDDFNALADGFPPPGAAWTAASHPRYAASGETLFLGAAAERQHFPPNRRGLWMWRGSGAPVELLLAGYGPMGGAKLDLYPVFEYSTTPVGSTVWAICNTDLSGKKGQSICSLDLRNTPIAPVLRCSRGDIITRPGQQPEVITSLRSVVGAEASPCGSAEKWAAIAQAGPIQKRNFVLVNGLPILWDGLNIDGSTKLIGEPNGLAMNENGDWVVGWMSRKVPQSGPDKPVLLLNGAAVDISGLVDGQWTIENFVREGNAGGTGSMAITSRQTSGIRILAAVMLRDTLSTATPQPVVKGLISVWAPSLAGCCPVDLTSNYQGTVHVPNGIVDDQDAQLFGLWATAKDVRGDLDDGSGTGTPDGVCDDHDITYFFDHYFMGCY